jgi:hypothetical protein
VIRWLLELIEKILFPTELVELANQQPAEEDFDRDRDPGDEA